ncbi:Increased recombination centers protein 6 [Caenorhabditis elegans]|uniref:Increased recombination centers protein 6 n=2 Tax=Caenorhabditis elegans TaxID=6239 RepID=A0A4V0III5_CAEEL|nr:Increased recombination centers protein 6 [Caenorhabditis elegans]VTW46364.1 Increased recombination centers protein 6 [Caenorhabditis elegans]
MSEKNEHFMVKCKGPPKQFLAIVGDTDGMIRKSLEERSKAVKEEADCYFIETYYYSAKYGIKTYETLSELSADYEANNAPIMCIFFALKSMDQLEEAKTVSNQVKADTKVIIVESLELCPDFDGLEKFVAENEFEVVFLKPNEDQLVEAAEQAEKIGVDRLIETMEVCNWPWRVVNAIGKTLQGTLSNFMDDEADPTEYNMNEDDTISGPAADQLIRHFAQWIDQNPDATIPAPQHAERVNLSPDSPTTTEGTTNQDDVSISVDIDLVCATKNLGENGGSSGENEKKAEKST